MYLVWVDLCSSACPLAKMLVEKLDQQIWPARIKNTRGILLALNMRGVPSLDGTSLIGPPDTWDKIIWTASVLPTIISILCDPQAIKYIHILKDRLAVFNFVRFTSQKPTRVMQKEGLQSVSCLDITPQSEVRR